MYIIYITVFIAILISCAYNYIEEFDFMDWLGSLIIAIVFGGIIGLFISVWIPPNKKYLVCETYDIESFKDMNSVSGDLFIGTGQINGTLKFIFYYKSNEGIKLGQVDPENVVIKYTNESPKIEKYHMSPVGNYHVNFDIKYSYVVYVPKGTIQSNYVLDSE